MIGNTGTYLDSPFHGFADGLDLAGLALDGLVNLAGLVVRVVGRPSRSVGADVLAGHQARGRAVLIHTGWDRHWATDQYGHGHPYLTADGAAWLAAEGAGLVGIDSLNIDDTDDLSRPAHTSLLRASIPIVEHLTGLEQLPLDGFRFTAAPPRVAGMGTWPVRAYATLER